MPRGAPFRKGDDPRRHHGGRGESARTKTLRELAAQDREDNFEALKKLRDEAEDERVRLEAAKTLAAYSDNKPSEGAPVPEQPKEDEGTEEIAKIFALPPNEEPKNG